MQRSQLGDSVAHTVIYGAARCLATVQMRQGYGGEHGSLSRRQSLKAVAENDGRIGAQLGQCIGHSGQAYGSGMSASGSAIVQIFGYGHAMCHLEALGDDAIHCIAVTMR